MKKIFIFLSVFTILFVAFCDVRERWQELDEALATTPSQLEIREPLNRKFVESNTLNLQNNNSQNYQDKIRNETKQHLQESINDINTKEQREQQKNPLKWR